ncbi:MAG: bifunctional 5,10-methylenetetrahydrofolate dehydrogenase/5,10-methenyltetrahydrofolate cyclohydrolase [Thermoplasmatota archaeon]
MDLLFGKPVAERILSDIKHGVGSGKPPVLAVYLIGDDPSSEIYARSKARKGEKIGIEVDLRRFPSDAGLDEILGSLDRDASDINVHGVMIERPLPEGMNIGSLTDRIPAFKDVEGLKPDNYGLMAMGTPRFIPPTPLGAILLLLHYGIPLEGRTVVVVGRSPNVGRPLSILLSQKKAYGNASVVLLHSRSGDPSDWTSRADIVITAVGRPKMLKGSMIRDGAVLIDLGINPVGDGIVGDVDMESVGDVASMATPTPGGTGPVTVAAMFLNLLRARDLQKGIKSSITDPLIRMIYEIA